MSRRPLLASWVIACSIAITVAAPSAHAAYNVTLSDGASSSMANPFGATFRAIGDDAVQNLAALGPYMMFIDNVIIETNDFGGAQAGNITIADDEAFNTANGLWLNPQTGTGTAFFNESLTFAGGGDLQVNGTAVVNEPQQADEIRMLGATSFGVSALRLLTGTRIIFGLASTIDTPNAVRTDSTSGTAFRGVVGGTTPPSLVDVLGPVEIETSAITTVGDQEYPGAVTFGTAFAGTSHALSCTGAGTIRFGGTVDAASSDFGANLDLDCAGTYFSETVGAVRPLASIDVLEATGETTMSSASITTLGTQTYAGDLRVYPGTTTLTAALYLVNGDVLLDPGSLFRVDGPVTFGTGSVTGDGAITKLGGGAMGFVGTHTSTGAIRNEGTGPIVISGMIGAPVTSVSGTVLGTGTTSGALSASSGGAIQPGSATPAASQVLTAGSLTLASGSFFLAPMLAADSPKLRAASVTLGGANLQFDPVALPAVGTEQEIIDNTGLAPVGGTFSGLPEGAITMNDTVAYRVSYVAGDGNDVTLTRVPRPTTITTAQSATTSTVRGSVTFTATVLGLTPTGTVTFTIDGVAQAPAAVAGGVATLVTGTLSTGTHTVTATYSGDGDDATSSAAPIQHVVNPQASTLALTQSAASSTAGTSITFTAAATASSITPVGSVTFLDGATSIGTATLDASGIASLATSTLAVGSHSITVRYDGGTDHAASTSGAVTHAVTAVVNPVVPPLTITAFKFRGACLPTPTSAGSVTHTISGAATITYVIRRVTRPVAAAPTLCPRLNRVTGAAPVTGTAFANVATKRVAVQAPGSRTITLKSILGRARLAPGRYQLVITAARASGPATQPTRLGFVVRASRA